MWSSRQSSRDLGVNSHKSRSWVAEMGGFLYLCYDFFSPYLVFLLFGEAGVLFFSLICTTFRSVGFFRNLRQVVLVGGGMVSYLE